MQKMSEPKPKILLFPLSWYSIAYFESDKKKEESQMKVFLEVCSDSGFEIFDIDPTAIQLADLTTGNPIHGKKSLEKELKGCERILVKRSASYSVCIYTAEYKLDQQTLQYKEFMDDIKRHHEQKDLFLGEFFLTHNDYGFPYIVFRFYIEA
jgi:hypothetical protein